MAKEIIVTGQPDKRITGFLQRQHVLTLATSHNNRPYCANCFYAYHSTDNVFVFTSDSDTKHIMEALANTKVAGTIYLDTRVIGRIRGIQFTGSLHGATNGLLKRYKQRFISRFPYTIASLSDIWYISPDWIKMTDNRLGFGTKLIWKCLH